MKKPPDHVIEAVAPSTWTIEGGLPLSDGSVRNVAHAEQHDTLRVPRGGDYDATLVAARKFYDGSSGGEAGHYLMLFVEFRYGGSRWRTAGLKVRSVEATRVIRALASRKPSVPGRNEPVRIGGKVLANDESSLRGAPVGKDGY